MINKDYNEERSAQLKAWEDSIVDDLIKVGEWNLSLGFSFESPALRDDRSLACKRMLKIRNLLANAAQSEGISFNQCHYFLKDEVDPNGNCHVHAVGKVPFQKAKPSLALRSPKERYCDHLVSNWERYGTNDRPINGFMSQREVSMTMPYKKNDPFWDIGQSTGVGAVLYTTKLWNKGGSRAFNDYWPTKRLAKNIRKQNSKTNIYSRRLDAREKKIISNLDEDELLRVNTIIDKYKQMNRMNDGVI